MTTTCTRCGGELEVPEDLATEIRREMRGALPPLAHEVCPDQAPERRTYSIEILIRSGPAPAEPPTDDETILARFTETTAAPNFIQAVPGIGRALGKKWEAVMESAHVIEAQE